MRVELFELRFNNSNSIYTAGQPVTGSVVIKLIKATFIESINIKFSGRAKSRWEVSNGDSSKHYKAHETYLDSEYCLYRCRNTEEKHPAGMHVYPFDFTLPADVPSSFEGRRGYVRYNCLVLMDRGWKGIMDIEQDLTVIRHLDLSVVPAASMPINLEGEEMYEGCCCDSGNVMVSMKLQKSGFVPGEPMYFDFTIHNQATSSIGGMVIALIQTVRYTGFSDSLFSSGNPKYHDKVNNWILYQFEDDVAAGKTYTFNTYCLIPAVAPSLLEGCGIIDIMYEVQLEIPVGWRTIRLNSNVFIGTIPLRRLTSVPPSSQSDHTVSVDSDLSSPPTRQNFELPPSYEECVFGRMESQEGNPNEVEDEDDQNVENNMSGTAARRSRLHRLPSYPYYSMSQFQGGGPYTSMVLTQEEPSAPPPPPPPGAGYTSLSTSDDLPYSSLPPPPSYESLQH